MGKFRLGLRRVGQGLNGIGRTDELIASAKIKGCGFDAFIRLLGRA
jgi:hypothetical protein